MALDKDKIKNKAKNTGSMFEKVKILLQRIEGGLHEFYVTPYRHYGAAAGCLRSFS
jgi:hypothetical protein